MDDIKAIKELANLNIERILEYLDISYNENYYYLTSRCPVHKGDRGDAWSWLLSKGTWKCFSRACDDEHGSDVFGLIQGVKRCTFKEAVEVVKKLVDCNISKEEAKRLRDSRQNKDFIISSMKKKNNCVIYPEECLEKLELSDYLMKRGFSQEILDLYHVGTCYDRYKYFSDRVVIPIRNKNSEIIGFTGRTIHENWNELGIPKWKHSKSYDASNNLFNIDRAAPHIKESGEAILTEGPLDVLRLEEAGIRNSVALLGKTLHPGQTTILLSIPTFTLLVAFDNDGAGRQGALKINKCSSSLFDVKLVKLPEDKNDIGDLSVEEVREVFKCSKRMELI